MIRAETPQKDKVVWGQIPGVESQNKRRLGNYGGIESGDDNQEQIKGDLGVLSKHEHDEHILT